MDKSSDKPHNEIKGVKFDILSTARTYIKFSPSWVAFGAIGYVAYLRAHEKRNLVSSVMRTINEDEKSSVINNIGSHELPAWPPRIGGIKVYIEESIRRDEIVMDVDLMLYSDARIKVSVGKIVAGVKDFELRGTLRILMKPLVSQIPFVGAVTVCFLDNPVTDFD
ncbi:Extended synaptotagmin-3 [Taenia crassiceps]|uniref:Extended synaptotagmin-3 n=1 Tax=Taenia crassiceps TaxID=6207 RepID=A0ABR4QTQ7_9CEST